MEQLEKKVLILLLFMALVLPFFANDYILHIMILVFYYVIMASSWNLLAGFSGQVSFAHMALAATGAYTSGLISIYFNVPQLVSILIGVIAAGFFGFVLGVLTLKMKGSYLALTTIAFSEIVRLTVSLEYQVTRGNIGLSVPSLFEGISSKLPYYYTGLILVVVVVFLGIYKLVYSNFGLTIRSIREDETAAAAMGVKVVRYKIIVFVHSSCMAGLAGSFLAHYNQLVSPQMITITQMGIVISMAVIGGLGSFIGPVIGGISLEIVSEYVKEFGNYHLMLFGLILVLVMRFSPRGIVGFLKAMHGRVKNKKESLISREVVVK